MLVEDTSSGCFQPILDSIEILPTPFILLDTLQINWQNNGFNTCLGNTISPQSTQLIFNNSNINQSIDSVKIYIF